MTDAVHQSEQRTSSSASALLSLREWARRWTFPLVVVGTLVFIAVAGPWLVPADPYTQNLTDRLASPSLSHPLGTDDLGRDMLSRMVLGFRTSLTAALIAVGIALFGGVAFGLAGGYFGGAIDRVVTLIHDSLLSFPPLLLAVGIVGVLGPGITNAMISVGIVLMPRFGRLIRSVTLRIKQEQYIEAAKSIGVRSPRMLRLYVLPNLVGPLTVQLTLAVAMSIIAEASLSFLGLGAQPPSTSLGLLLSRGFSHVYSNPLGLIAPMVVLVAVILALTMAGERIRDKVEGNRRMESVL